MVIECCAGTQDPASGIPSCRDSRDVGPVDILRIVVDPLDERLDLVCGKPASCVRIACASGVSRFALADPPAPSRRP